MVSDFNPNGAAEPNSGVFGFPYSIEESDLLLIPAPWEATCSYGAGASEAPNHILAASMFVELFDTEYKDFYSRGIAWLPQEKKLVQLSAKAQDLARPIIDNAGVLNDVLKIKKEEVDELCEEMNNWIQQITEKYASNKKIGIIGGDHSVALGAIKAFDKKYDNFGVLQLDAHSDLRSSFESLKYSHASVFDNVIGETKIDKLVQVGVRGFCQEEHDKTISSGGRINTFYESEMVHKLSIGTSWDSICNEIVNDLPSNVYISFDIDCLTRENCPNTGTPMPGGMTYQQAIYLLRKVSSNRNIVGFDLVEVSCGDNGDESWDAIVAANLLYKLCATTICSKSNR